MGREGGEGRDYTILSQHYESCCFGSHRFPHHEMIHGISCLSLQKLSKLLAIPDIDTNQLNSSGMGPLHSLAKREFKKGNTLGTDLLYTFLTKSDVTCLTNQGTLLCISL